MQARLVNTTADKAAGDALIIPVFQGEKALPQEAQSLDRKLKGAITGLLKDGEFRGRLLEVAFVHNLNNATSKWTVLVGVGKQEKFDLVRFRNALHAAARSLRKRGHKEVTVLLTKDLAGKTSPADLARAVTEGVALGNFDHFPERAPTTRVVRRIDTHTAKALNFGQTGLYIFAPLGPLPLVTIRYRTR